MTIFFEERRFANNSFHILNKAAAAAVAVAAAVAPHTWPSPARLSQGSSRGLLLTPVDELSTVYHWCSTHGSHPLLR